MRAAARSLRLTSNCRTIRPKYCSSTVIQQQRSICGHTSLLTSSSTDTTCTRTKIWHSPFPPVAVSTDPLHSKLMKAMDDVIAKNPEHLAFVSGEHANQCVTYKELKRQAVATSAYLNKIGFKKGDVAAVVLPNGPCFIAALLGSLGCGGSLTTSNPLCTVFELNKQLIDSNTKVIFTHEVFLEKVMTACKEAPSVKQIVCIKASENRLPPGVIDYVDVITTKGEAPKVDTLIEDTVCIPYSSGTTGTPKGVMLSNRALSTMIDIIAQYLMKNVGPKIYNPEELQSPDLWANSPQLSQLPMFHIYGFVCTLTQLCLGSTTVYMTKFDPLVYLKVIEKFKIRYLMVVPPIMVFLDKHPAVAKFNLDSVKVIISGAAPTGKELMEDLLKKRPNVQFAQAYGLSETAMASHLADFNERVDYTSIGYPAATTEMKIIDDKGRELGPDESGEICIRGPCLMTAYLNNPTASADTIKDGWLHTGDIGYANDEGLTHIVDRKKELIKVKTMQVAPAELEDVLIGHPKIVDAAVIGVPHMRTGEAAKAFVVRGCESLTEADVFDYIKGRLSEHKWLHGGVQFVPEIPKQPSGKILRRVLREKYTNCQ